MVRDDRLYLEGLAKELGVLLVGRNGSGGLMVGEGARGVVGLDEVWVIWMRARGVGMCSLHVRCLVNTDEQALLPPETLISILNDLPSHTNPQINVLTLPSALKVLHTPHYSTQALLSRLLTRLQPDEKEYEESISVIELASAESLAIGITKEMLESVEMTRKEYGVIGGVGGVVRDDQASGGVRWYRDLISEWTIDRI
jgi:ESCRT-II complex subunit VPS36